MGSANQDYLVTFTPPPPPYAAIVNETGRITFSNATGVFRTVTVRINIPANTTSPPSSQNITISGRTGTAGPFTALVTISVATASSSATPGASGRLTVSPVTATPAGATYTLSYVPTGVSTVALRDTVTVTFLNAAQAPVAIVNVLIALDPPPPAPSNDAAISGRSGTAGPFATQVMVAAAVASASTSPGASGTLSVSPLSGLANSSYTLSYRPSVVNSLALRDAMTVRFLNAAGDAVQIVNVSVQLDPPDPGVIVDPAARAAVMSDPIAMQTVTPLRDLCAAATAAGDTALIEQCRALSNASAATIVQAFRAIAAEEVTATVSASQDSLNFANTGANNRLSALRGGATRTSSDDLAFNLNGQQFPMGLMSAVLGLDSDDQSAANAQPGGLFGQRFGLFFSGIIRRGERDATVKETGFEFDGWQALAGIDYRFTNQLVAGVALGAGKIDAELDQSGGSLTSRSRFFTLFASLTPNERAYFDLAYSRLSNDYDQARLIDLTAQGVPLALASGESQGEQFSLSLSAGYEFSFDATSLVPNVRWTKGQTEIDGFTERGPSNFNLILPDQSFESQQFAAGINVSHAFSTANGVIVPFANVELIAETKNDAFRLLPRFARFNTAATPIDIAASDQRYGRFDVGMTMLRSNGWQFALSYSETFAFEFLSSSSLQFSGRFEF